MRITHEFPLQFYLNGFAEAYTDYDYCLVHRYIENKEYRDYMREQVNNGRIVYLDNSLYELGSSWDSEEYARIIKDLNPTYYMLPDVFDDAEKNIESQLDFYKRYSNLKSIPIAIPHAKDVITLGMATSELCLKLPSEAMIAIPFADNSFKNEKCLEGYFNPLDIPYEPLRQAINRKLFLKTASSVLKDRKIHLLGCKSLAEFDNWGSNFPKDNIVSLDTSHPVAMTLEDNFNYYDWGFFTLDKIKMPMHCYKPIYLIDKHFNDSFDMNSIQEDLERNINYFQEYVNRYKSRRLY